jgi:hypothetical protein
MLQPINPTDQQSAFTPARRPREQISRGCLIILQPGIELRQFAIATTEGHRSGFRFQVLVQKRLYTALEGGCGARIHKPFRRAQQLMYDLQQMLTIDDGVGRANALSGLAPHLTSEQLADALAAAKAIDDGDARDKALRGLAPHLTSEQLADALTAAKAISDARNRGNALSGLAPHLTSEQLADALVAAKAIDDGFARANALRGLAPHLTSEQLADALTAARAHQRRG